MYIEYVPISQIKVKPQRIRTDFGNLKSLQQSIKTYGLISPILLTNDYHLVAGHRRYLAVKQLMWDKIPAIILPYQVSKLNLLEIEVEENLQRKAFSQEELISYKNKKYRLLFPWYKRLWIKIRIFFRKFLLGSVFKKKKKK